MRVYTLEEFIKVGQQNGTVHLEKLFADDEFLSKIYVPQYRELKQIIADPQGFGQQKLAEYEKILLDLKTNMQNIIDAIGILREMRNE